MTDTPMKRCSRKAQCRHPKAVGGWLPATSEYFPGRRGSKSGFASQCKICKRQAEARWRKENPEKVREKARRWRTANPERALNVSRRWCANNPEKARANRARSYANNFEKARHQHRQWRVANPEAIAARDARRRAREHAAPGKFTAADVRAQYASQTGLCYYCGCALDGRYHIDHYIPLVRGGTNRPDNIVCACAFCNLSKGDKLPTEWVSPKQHTPPTVPCQKQEEAALTTVVRIITPEPGETVMHIITPEPGETVMHISVPIPVPTNNISIFHVYWRYIDTPAWVPAPNMWVACNAADEPTAITETRQHAADRRPGVAVEIVRVEEWRLVPGVEGVEFSSLDRVRQNRKRLAHIREPITLDSGERGFLLLIGREYTQFSVNHLRSLAFPEEK